MGERMQLTTMPAHNMRLAARPPGASPMSDTPAIRRDLEQSGIPEPFLIRPVSGRTEYEVLTQPARFMAALRLGIPDVPVLVRDDLDDEQAARVVSRHYGLTKNNPIDDAESLLEQLEFQRAGDGEGSGAPNISRLARLVGRGRTEVTRSLQLLDLPADVQEFIRRGDMPPSHARPLLKLTTACLLYTSPSPRDATLSRMPSSA